MTGPTHRQYAILFAYLTVICLYGLGITKIYYYPSLIIILLTAKSGALFPDVDHAWQNVHDKTVLNKIINTLIHLTGGKHRSWQTHSIDICAWYILLSYILPLRLYNLGKIDAVNYEVISLLLFGFASGWVSHLFSDMLTSEGVRLFCFCKFKVHLVPKRIGKLKFNTGHEWEAFNYKVIKASNILVGIICILYPIINFEALKNIIKI